MADFEHKENTGSIFLNLEATEKQPDWSGSFNFEGKQVEIVGWNNQTKTGKDYISLKVSVPREESKGKNSDSWQAAKQRFNKDDDTEAEAPINIDDIPF